MGKSSSNDELTIRNQFDRICKLALKGEAADYYRHIAYRQKHEVLFSELSQKELDSIFGVDKYTVENKCFRILGYDIEVKDTLLAEAIQSLSENKRKVVLLSYFMDMSDADIARMMNLVRSTVYEHRKRSLELMKEMMEEYQNEQEKQKNEAFDLPSFQMIRAASNGDIEAINAVLKHYEGYIAALSTRKMYDENRQVHYCVDETLRRRLETKLITKILAFEIQLGVSGRKYSFLFFAVSEQVYLDNFIFFLQDAENSGAV